MSRFLRHSRLCVFLNIKQKDFILRFFPSSISTTLWFDNNYSEQDYNIISKFLKKDEVFVDVGANIGHLSIHAKMCVGEKGTVLAIEGNPETFSYLEKNIKLNNIIINTFPVLVGDRKKTVTLENRKADDMNQVIENNLGKNNYRNIKMITLDNVCSNLDQINLLKIDVEGYEYKVLLGAKETLKKTKYLMIEIIDSLSIKFDSSFKQTNDLILSFGFREIKNNNSNNFIFERT